MYHLSFFVSVCPGPIDIMILLDTDLYLQTSDFTTTINGLERVVSNINNVFPINATTGAHVGVAYYNSQGTLLSGLLQGTSVSAIQTSIGQIPNTDARTYNFTQGLQVCLTEIVANSRNKTVGNTRRAAMVVLTFLNSRPSDEMAGIIQSNIMKAQNIQIVPYSISPDVPLKLLQQFATKPDKVQYISYGNLGNLYAGFGLQQLSDIFCPIKGMYSV